MKIAVSCNGSQIWAPRVMQKPLWRHTCVENWSPPALSVMSMNTPVNVEIMNIRK